MRPPGRLRSGGGFAFTGAVAALSFVVAYTGCHSSLPRESPRPVDEANSVPSRLEERVEIRRNVSDPPVAREDRARRVAPAGGPAATRFDEIRIDMPSSDLDEYIELYGAGGSDMTGDWIVVLGDGTGGSGVVEEVIDLAGITMPPSGFLVIAESTFTIGVADVVRSLNLENGDNVTYMLVFNFTGSLNDDLDANDDGVLDTMPWTSVTDVIAVIEETNPPTGTEFHYGPPTVGPDGTWAPGHVYRCPDGSGPWSSGPFDLLLGVDTPGAPNPCCGDGFADNNVGEECDDGPANGTLASCCQSDCTYLWAATPCDDGMFCTPTDTCDGVGVCVGAGTTCDDGYACTTDSCDEVADVCVNMQIDAVCRDGLFCNGAELCDPADLAADALGCVGGVPPAVADGVVCTDDSCDEGADLTDDVGTVVNAPNDLVCDDSNVCTVDSCDPVAGCQNMGMCPATDAGAGSDASASGSDASASGSDGGIPGVDSGTMPPPPRRGCFCRAGASSPGDAPSVLASFFVALLVWRRRVRHRASRPALEPWRERS